VFAERYKQLPLQLVAACWGLPARKSILVKVKQPNLEECPTWQVVRYLNQAGRCPLPFLPANASGRHKHQGCMQNIPKYHSCLADCCVARFQSPPLLAGAIMPSHMLAVYLTRGEVGQAMLREDAATFSRTWECERVLQCIDYVDGPEPRM
jgi:hypothetical protein